MVFGTQTADEAFNDTSCVVIWNMQTGLNVKMMHRKPQLSPAVESCDHYWDFQWWQPLPVNLCLAWIWLLSPLSVPPSVFSRSHLTLSPAVCWSYLVLCDTPLPFRPPPSHEWYNHLWLFTWPTGCQGDNVNDWLERKQPSGENRPDIHTLLWIRIQRNTAREQSVTMGTWPKAPLFPL